MFHACCRLLTFFKINFFKNNFQSVKLFATRSGPMQLLSVPIWVKIVCKVYQQTIEVSTSKESVMMDSLLASLEVGTHSYIMILLELIDKFYCENLIYFHL